MADVSNIREPFNNCQKGVSHRALFPIKLQFSQIKMTRHSMYTRYTSSMLYAKVSRQVPMPCFTFMPILLFIRLAKLAFVYKSTKSSSKLILCVVYFAFFLDDRRINACILPLFLLFLYICGQIVKWYFHNSIHNK